MVIKKKMFSGIALALSVGLLVGEASANHPSAPAVAISWTGGVPGSLVAFTANGSLGAAHNSSSANEEIGCYVRAYGDIAAGNDMYEASCWAVKSDRTMASCNVNGRTQQTYRLVNAMGTLNGSSYLEFKGANGGDCTEITVDNNSKYVAKNSGVKAGATDEPVSVEFDPSGSLGSARNSSDTVQYIYCGVSLYNASDLEGTCFAEDAAGVQVGCSTTRAHDINALSMVKPDSWVSFGPEECGRVEINNSSRWRPSH